MNDIFKSKEKVSAILYTTLGLQKNKIPIDTIEDIVQGGMEAVFLLRNFFGVDYRKIGKQRMKEIADYVADDFLKRFKAMEND